MPSTATFITPLLPSTCSKPLSSPTNSPTFPKLQRARNTPPRQKPRACLPPPETVPYFAYFANMNPNKLGPTANIRSRRCNLHRSENAILQGYDLSFDVPGLPPEPVFANIAISPASAVHGVLHYLSRPDFSRVIRSEGFGNPFVRIVQVSVLIKNSHGEIVKAPAKTIVYSFPLPPFLRSRLRPSRRYVQVAVAGAEYWAIDNAYIHRLRSITTDTGILGGFGLFTEPRPHFLDRPNSYERFGNASSEVFSPWKPVRSRAAVEKFERHGHSHGRDLRLLRVSNTSREGASNMKSLYYIPGIDGTGKGIMSQIHGLDEEGVYDVSSFIYPFDNRQTLKQLAEQVLKMVKEDAGDKAVTIVGESMGGVVAILAAMENSRRLRDDSSLPHLNIDLLLLINPATSFKRSDPRAIWDFLLSLGFSEDMYNRLLPPVLVPFIIDFNAFRDSFRPDSFPRLRKLLFSLTEISKVLPKDAMSWRLKLLSHFSIGKDQLQSLGGQFGPSRIALISSVNDNLIPSHSESYRLRRYIPNLYTMVLPYGGHIPSFDSRFSLAAFLKAFHYAPQTGNNKSLTIPSPSVLRRRAALRKRFANGTNPRSDDRTREELGKLRAFLERFTKDSSPVFVGEENIPEYDPNRPILFVCNHTLLGWLDAMYPVERILKERNVLVRSLAHPKLFEQTRQGQIVFPNTTRVSRADMDDFGIIQVSARQLVEQLGSGRWSLLFPGGAREALKENEGQKYSLKWPEEPEFIRACALFGAQVIPVSTVGSEDMVRILASPKQVQRVLDTGSRLIGRPIDWKAFSFEGVPQRDRMVTDGDIPLIPPLMVPNGPDRIYFRFGKPIDIEEACLYDERLERELYNKVRDGVREGMETLLRRRNLDDYRTVDRRKEFQDRFGEHVHPPCGHAWLWSKNGSFLDEEKQPPLH